MGVTYIPPFSSLRAQSTNTALLRAAALATWINQSRLAGADESRFLVWLEDHGVMRAGLPHVAARDNLYGVCDYAAGSGLDALAIALAQNASKLRGEEASRSRSSSLH